MFTVFFETYTYNQHRTYFQNANRHMHSKSFKTLAEAQEFAESLKSNDNVRTNTIEIYSPIGVRVR